MIFNTTQHTQGLFKSVMLAYFILILHVILAAGLVLLVVFFHGVTTHLLWILSGGITLILVSGYLFYRRMKSEGKTLRDILNSPVFNGRSVEINLLNGLACFRLGKERTLPVIESKIIGPERQLEEPVSMKIRKLSELAGLVRENLITIDEYNLLKKELFEDQESGVGDQVADELTKTN
jgi:hypothetical protein